MISTGYEASPRPPSCPVRDAEVRVEPSVDSTYDCEEDKLISSREPVSSSLAQRGQQSVDGQVDKGDPCDEPSSQKAVMKSSLAPSLPRSLAPSLPRSRGAAT